jgi:hypothetical protein
MWSGPRGPSGAAAAGGWPGDWTWAVPTARGKGRLGELSCGHDYRED